MRKPTLKEIMTKRDTLVSCILAVAVDKKGTRQKIIDGVIQEAAKRHLIVTKQGAKIEKKNTSHLLSGIIGDILKCRDGYWQELKYEKEEEGIIISKR